MEEEMNNGTFEALTRRASLMSLGTAGLIALTNPFVAGAKKKQGKNKGKNGDVNKLCKGQVGECTTALTALCAGDPDCQDLIACCSNLGRCNFTSFLDCQLQVS
jgi:hypothetical protein